MFQRMCSQLAKYLNGSRPIVVWSLKVAVSVAVMLTLFTWLPLENVTRILGKADTTLVAAAGILFFGVNCLASYKWQLLTRAQELTISFRQAWATYFVGLFFNSFLPSGFGGDAVRAYRVARQEGDGMDAILSVGFDRAHSLWAILLIATPASLHSAAMLKLPWEIGAMFTVLITVSSCLALTFLFSVTRSWIEVGSSHLPFELGRAVSKLMRPFQKLGANWRLIAWSSLVAITFQGLGYVVQFLLFASLRVPISFSVLVTVVSLATIVSVLPISINGIGVREGAYVMALSATGVDSSAAITLSVLSLAMLISNSLIGGIVFVLENRVSVGQLFRGRRDVRQHIG